MKIALVLFSMLFLVGCKTTDLPASTLEPICKALVGPIRYNSKNKDSLRYAAAKLVPDLKQRNQIGQQLGCPEYM